MQPFLCLRVLLKRRSGRDPSESNQLARREIAKVRLDFGSWPSIIATRCSSHGPLARLATKVEDCDNSEEALRQH
jgi:hypothetical protein